MKTSCWVHLDCFAVSNPLLSSKVQLNHELCNFTAGSSTNRVESEKTYNISGGLVRLYIIRLGMGVCEIALNFQSTVTYQKERNRIQPNGSLSYLTSEASQGMHTQ